MSNLYALKNYLFGFPYLVATPIYEYDISKANINILYHDGVITKEQLNHFALMSRNDREKSIGLMIRENSDIQTILSDGIIEMKKRFFESNNILDTEVLAIKNDAVFVIGRKMTYTKFENVEFALKNFYSIYMKIFNLEIYYRSDQVTGLDMIDVKGINDKKLELHRDGMMVIISEVFEQLDCGNVEDALAIFNQYYMAYVNRQLPIQFYRTFDANSAYIISAMGTMYTVSCANVSDVDISYNLNFLRQIYGYISHLYFNTRK